MKRALFLITFFISACNFSTNYSTNKEYSVIDESKTEGNLKHAEIIGKAALKRFADEAQIVLDGKNSSTFNINWGTANTEEGKVKVYVRCGYNGQFKPEEVKGLTAMINKCYEYIAAEFKK